MPCDSISTVDVDAGKMDAQHVKRALEAMRLHPTHTRANIYNHDAGSYNHVSGVAEWYGEDRTAELKKTYSTEVLKTQAARFGWTLKQDTKTQKFQLIKR